MAILSYNEVLPKKIIIWNDEPYEVLSSWVFRKQQRKPVNQTKLRNLKSGKVVEISFHQSESIPEADVERKELTYIYTAKGESWFHEVGNTKERIAMPQDVIAHQIPFMKEHTDVTALVWNDEIIGLTIPIKMELAVKEAPPSVKGNTAQGGSKQVVLETGATVSVPLFINEGDIIRINTDTGEYVERVNKA